MVRRKTLRGLCQLHPESVCSLITEDNTFVCPRCASHELVKDLGALSKFSDGWNNTIFNDRKEKFAALHKKMVTLSAFDSMPELSIDLTADGEQQNQLSSPSASKGRENLSLKDVIASLKEKKKEIDTRMYNYNRKRQKVLEEVRQRASDPSKYSVKKPPFPNRIVSFAVDVAHEVDVGKLPNPANDIVYDDEEEDDVGTIPIERKRMQIFEKTAATEQEQMRLMASEQLLKAGGTLMDAETKDMLLKSMSNFLFLEQDMKDNSIKMNYLLKSLKREEFTGGQIIITEGESGYKLYILEQGEVEIYIDQQKVREMKRGAIFGELALLYDAPRSATVRCKEGDATVVLWSLSRHIFKQIQIDSSNALQTQRARWLTNSPDLAVLGAIEISRLVSAFQPLELKPDEKLFTMNEVTDRCIVIERGFVSIYASEELVTDSTLEAIDKALGIIRPTGSPKYVYEENSRYASTLVEDAIGRGLFPPHIPSKHVCDVMEGCILGIEILRGKAGLPNSWRWLEGADKACGVPVPYTAVASSDVNYLMFTVDTFERIIGRTIDVFHTKFHSLSKQTKALHDEMVVKKRNNQKFDVTKFSIKHLLGSGSFGYVALATYDEKSVGVDRSLGVSRRFSRSNNSVPTNYAIKLFSKFQIERTGQLEQLYNEKKVLSVLNSPFILRLYGTAQSTNHLFIVSEVLDCGDLWGLIYTGNPNPHHSLPGDLILFYTASIVLGLTHMHDKGFAHRDIKPENIMLDKFGYLRIIDFGFAKSIPFSVSFPNGETRIYAKSFTLCGTPEYLPPEVIAHAGHDHSVDLWALGILIYEMYMIRTPFRSSTNSNNVKEIFMKVTSLKKNGLHIKKALDARAGSSVACDLVTSLIQYDPTKRAGYAQGSTKYILSHKFFDGLNISAVESGEMIPSYIPPIIKDHESAKKLPPVRAYHGSQTIFSDF